MEQQKRIFGLDLIRSIAILSVFFYHFQFVQPQAPLWMIRIGLYGWQGVDLFFVLSGFLIGDQVFNTVSPSSKWLATVHFWAKRWTRTVPLYWPVLFFYVVIKPLIVAPFYGGFHWSYIFFLQNVFTQIQDFHQSWSLCIEEQFYLVLPVVVFFLGIRHWAWWIGAIIISMYLRYLNCADWSDLEWFTKNINDKIRHYTHLHLDGLGFGLLLASLKSYWTKFSRTWIIFIGSISLLGHVLVCYILGNELTSTSYIFYFPLISLLFSGMIIGSHSIESLGPLNPLIQKISLWSYSAYLLNNIMMRFLDKYFKNTPWILGLIFFAISTFGVSYFTYRFIEIPGMKLRKLAPRLGK